ncbi:hypothetical protein BROUX41_005711 [Berkeleyomyces rouxiae]|uniref:uncharacterized protein n=1 Tax=Berkeleyomyces rouxiae TaxID=2035830 RepID=UPI003B7A5D14
MFSLVSSLSSYGSWQQNCTVTHSEMRHLDLTQPPLMKRPLRTFRELEFVCKLNVLVPSKVAVELGKRLENLALTSGVTRLTMSLHDVLTGIFFLKSFKNGKVMMISETDSHRDTIFVFVNGKLTMHVDKESYEKSGLVGKPESNCSQTKDRWIVEYDLTCKSMAPGKAGFERLLYACKNVYTEKRKWLYTDMSEKGASKALIYTPR